MTKNRLPQAPWQPHLQLFFLCFRLRVIYRQGGGTHLLVIYSLECMQKLHWRVQRDDFTGNSLWDKHYPARMFQLPDPLEIRRMEGKFKEVRKASSWPLPLPWETNTHRHAHFSNLKKHTVLLKRRQMHNTVSHNGWHHPSLCVCVCVWMHIYWGSSGEKRIRIRWVMF